MLGDLEQVARDSGVRIELELGKIPRLPDHRSLAESLGIDPLRALLAGGEDYQLVCASEPGREWGHFATRIGTVVEGEAGVIVVDEVGAPVSLSEWGAFDHFD